MMIIALLLYARDEAVGLQCLAAAITQQRLQEGSGGYEGWELHVRSRQLIQSQMARQPYMPRSYFAGTAPEQGYELPAPPHDVQFSANPYSGDPESGHYKVFVVSSGADSPRPVTVSRNPSGIWQAYEWSSLLVGVKEPRP
jgi:hypothetical protein